MKKAIVLFLIPVFLLMTTGVTITSLFCDGELSEVGIHVTACCDDVNKGGCCNTTSKVVKVEDAFLSNPGSIETNKSVDCYVPTIQVAFLSEGIISTHFESFWDKAPPSVKDELYIYFCTMII